ncbi:MAG: hypothetical protein LAO51_17645, partial [Acidobacteriia bacterium]|nr:hypothetical protein [Terriglobia bacterium]
MSRSVRDSIFAVLHVEDYLLLAAVVLLPWAFGGVRLWAYRSAAFLIAAASAAALIRKGWPGLGGGKGGAWLLPAFLLAGWAALQAVPLPPAVVRLVSPGAYAIYVENFPGYPGPAPSDVAAAIEADALDRVPEARIVPPPSDPAPPFTPEVRGRWSGWRSLSLHPAATIERLFWYVALLLAFLLARTRVAERGIFSAYGTVLFCLFGTLAAFGLVQKATWNGKIFWVTPKTEMTHPFGPYVNFIHF